MSETTNAVIRSTKLTSADYGLLSVWLDLDYGGSGQAFGGYCLYSPKQASPINVAGHFIWRIMEVAGVAEWDDLPGKTIRVRHEHTKVHAIGHIVKDDWFDPTADFERMKASATVGVANG